MPTRLGLLTHDGSLDAAAQASHDALARPLEHPVELLVADLVEDGELLGAFQRRSDARDGAVVARRASGGASVRAGSGVVHAVLALASPSALVPTNEDQLLNRYVRPFLAALTKLAAPARYFGRDWISVDHRPAAHLSFGHLQASGRTVIEVFVGARRSFAAGPRSSHLGKEPICLDDVARAPIDAARLRAALALEFAERHGLEAVELEPHRLPPSSPLGGEPPWAASIDEAIGPICAGRDRGGVLRLGGELMASTDAVAELEARCAASVDLQGSAFDAIVDAVFTAPKVALFGVRSLQSLRDVLSAALDA